ncbi:endonuclease MutS2 [Lentisphaera profundi]|uniref:Endonuclease MutS2 n=1 Tax=Lentisphaera profundi TaxID=1658616 RepID=A0ABY7W245_9BACT|nr:endonuclease MutS2 [Lentisphaera profundi]WDE98353.1 endonuclease MutS2 [Lentisphaera profundi]
MNQHSQKILEFPDLLNWIASYARSTSGKMSISRLQPSSAKVPRRQQLYKDFDAVTQLIPEGIPCSNFSLPDLKRLNAEDSWIEPDEIIEVRSFIHYSAQMYSCFNKESLKAFDSIRELHERILPFRELRDEFNKIFDAKDHIKDSASKELAEIRPMIRKCEKAIKNRLDYYLKNDKNEIFQEKYITSRNDRFCLPLKRDQKSKLKGIVHDESATGQTIFIEPESIVALGNERAGMLSDERKIIFKIIQELCSYIRSETPDLLQAFKTLTLCDQCFAVEAWSSEVNARFPKVGKVFKLINARHPLLFKTLKEQGHEDHLVPLNMELPSDLTTLAVTGSNTGGKTLILKTIGLLSIMHQSGLPVPLNEFSELPLFEDILADIGDEQSISQNLSTFSAHLKSISAILKSARQKQSLILLDELGSGTDPVEGGALGNAILMDLAKSESLTLLTTHIGAIKVFAQEREGMMNAAVRFNRESLRPEYILDIGIPGASHAIEIARNHGLPHDILKDAKSFLSDKELKLENVIGKLQKQQSQMQQDAREAQKSRDTALKEAASVQEELTTLRRERKDILRQAQKEAESILNNARSHVEKIERKLKKHQPDTDISDLRKQIIQKRDGLRTALDNNQVTPVEPIKDQELKEGDKVWVEKLQSHAKIIKVEKKGKQFLLDADGMQITIKRSELGTAESVPEVRKPKIKQAKQSYHVSNNVSMEIKLIGMYAEAALRELDNWLSSAYGSNHDQVKVIHGRGTGQLRRAVHKHLAAQKYIQRFYCPDLSEDPAGDAVTWVEFKR